MIRAILPLLLLTGAIFAEQSPHKQVSLSIKILDRYVGSYTMPGVIMKVTRENSHLFIQKNDEPRTEIFAEHELKFFSKSSEDVITFEGISGGKAIIMRINSDGKSTPLARIQ